MSDNSEKDIILFNEIKKGKQKAFDELFNLYYHDLCDFSNLMSNNKPCAEEVVADVFANIWIKRKKLKINKSVKAYLFRSTKNTTISYLRKRKNIYEPIEEDQLNIKNQDFSPDKNLLKEEQNLKLEKLLKIIPERSREIFILHRFNGFKYRDIAETLDISVKTVEKHMTKALRLLRDVYRNKTQNN
ncbi:MAG: RNA polymerase sigma-70 factor [Bacteroidetes bacterium]|nr:MAG: RNA polymerase sigma-70 factor [Bacteroidota bacterium]